MARIISAIILVPCTLFVVIYAPPGYFLIGVGLAGTACLHEYFKLIRSMGIHAQSWFSYFAFWALLIAFRYGPFPVAAILSLVLLALFLSAIWRPLQTPKERISGLMAELLGILYFALCLYPIVPLRFDFGERTGLHWTLFLFFVIWAGDAIALAVGKTLGKSPFAPVLSPSKTKEGAIAGMLAGCLVAVALQHFIFSDLPLRHVIFSSVLIGVFGQLGDLAESMLKRAAEVKDSSHIIPGHGGVLDRMDSLLFAFPVLYFYLLQIH